jgi:hypothetical protein
METMVRLYTDALMYQEEADVLSDDDWAVVACVSHRKGVVDFGWWFLPGCWLIFHRKAMLVVTYQRLERSGSEDK